MVKFGNGFPVGTQVRPIRPVGTANWDFATVKEPPSEPVFDSTVWLNVGLHGGFPVQADDIKLAYPPRAGTYVRRRNNYRFSHGSPVGIVDFSGVDYVRVEGDSRTFRPEELLIVTEEEMKWRGENVTPEVEKLKAKIAELGVRFQIENPGICDDLWGSRWLGGLGIEKPKRQKYGIEVTHSANTPTPKSTKGMTELLRTYFADPTIEVAFYDVDEDE